MIFWVSVVLNRTVVNNDLSNILKISAVIIFRVKVSCIT